MSDYETLKKRCIKPSEDGDEENDHLNVDELKPGMFLLYYHHAGGSPCIHESYQVCLLQDSKEALAFLKFIILPWVLHYSESDDGEIDLKVIRDQYDDEFCDEFEGLVKQVDIAIKSETLDIMILSEILDTFNDIFEEGYPMTSILGWGDLTEFLDFPCCQDRFEFITEEDETFYLKLKELLDSGEFDENNPEHFSLAKEFVKQLNR